ncbi:terminase small subunit [Pararhodobacter marinus]|uniref:terminase small subunit n=1 Tax=Pararhodobacter marinus TaxID=2184063 RepID=UPI0035175871
MTDLITLTTGEVLDVSAWPLPDGVVDDGEPLNRKELADVFGKSENTITSWISKGMPVQSGGSNGVAYGFSLSHCWAWRQWRDAEERAVRSRRDERNNQNALIFRNLDPDQAEEEGGMSAAELRAWSEAEYHRNRVAEQRGDLVRAQAMRQLLDKLMVSVGSAFDTLPDYAELNFGLTAEQVAKLQERCDGVRVELRQSIERELSAPAVIVPIGARQGDLGF